VLVLHTFVQTRAIRTIKLDGDELANPMIWVYKSGSVVIVASKNESIHLTLCHPTGDRLLERSFPGHICESDKCYGFDGREYLLVGTEQVNITLYEVATFNLIIRIPTPEIRPLFCSVKGRIGIFQSDGSSLVETCFESIVPTVIEA
jgi:hypothetical protein